MLWIVLSIYLFRRLMNLYLDSNGDDEDDGDYDIIKKEEIIPCI